MEGMKDIADSEDIQDIFGTDTDTSHDSEIQDIGKHKILSCN